MSEPAPRIAFLARGGALYVGIESGALETPGLQYPAIVQVLCMPSQGSVPGSIGVTTLITPVLLPLPVLPLHAGEVLQPCGAEDQRYPLTADFLPQYLAAVERQKAGPARIVPVGTLFGRGR